MFRCIAPLLVVLAVTGSAHGDEGLSLGTLLQRFAEMPGLSAKFREEKRIALLAVPLRSEGEIHFEPPGRFLRKVHSPTKSSALIAGGALTLEADGRRERIDLTDNAIVAGFVDSFRHVLAGDRAALERTYDVELGAGSTEDRWELTLRPKTRQLKRFVTRMVFEGQRDHVKRMRLVEASGDETVTEFYDVEVHRWSGERAAEVFGSR